MMMVPVPGWRPWAAALMGLAAASLARALPTPAEDSAAVAAIDADSVTQEQQAVVMVETPRPRMDIYGFAMADMGYDFKQIDPDWVDVLRTTKLPSFANEFGQDGNFYADVKQSRFGVKGYLPTAIGEVKTIFEFDLFGVGSNTGETAFHLRHAWGELSCFGAGQSWTPFMDPDVFPNSLDYWGPPGTVSLRNVQVRWMPMRGQNELFFALEKPGATADEGHFADRTELQHVSGHFPAPDFTAHYRRTGDWGHVQLAGALRYIAWVDTEKKPFDLSDHKIGWGVNLTGIFKVTKTGTIRAGVVWGDGIENYMDDAPVDVGIAANFNDPARPIVGRALPVVGFSAFYDTYWSDQFSSAFGYSMVDITNSNGQLPSAFHKGQYALANLLYYPVKNVMAGLEFLWGRRENFRDGFSVDDYRLQFSARYNFDFHLGGPHP